MSDPIGIYQAQKAVIAEEVRFEEDFIWVRDKYNEVLLDLAADERIKASYTDAFDAYIEFRLAYRYLFTNPFDRELKAAAASAKRKMHAAFEAFAAIAT
jgi:hypothetical protein